MSDSADDASLSAAMYVSVSAPSWSSESGELVLRSGLLVQSVQLDVVEFAAPLLERGDLVLERLGLAGCDHRPHLLGQPLEVLVDLVCVGFGLLDERRPAPRPACG